jgi:anti-sigma regulatory factor (Ser/Thr protein kinase)
MRSEFPYPVDQRPPTPVRLEGAVWLDEPIALDALAPRTAREKVVDALAGRVSALTIEQAKLVASELVTNSLVHSGAGEGAEITVTLRAGARGCRIEVKDPGHRGGAITPRAPDRVNGGGMGLIVVDAMCAQWGVLRDADGSSRVWAELVDDGHGGSR